MHLESSPSKPYPQDAGTALTVGAPGHHNPRRHQTDAHLEGIGLRIKSISRLGWFDGAGYEPVHVAIDAATHLAYFGVLPDE
jgi:hypothetical protein